MEFSHVAFKLSAAPQAQRRWVDQQPDDAQAQRRWVDQPSAAARSARARRDGVDQQPDAKATGAASLARGAKPRRGVIGEDTAMWDRATMTLSFALAVSSCSTEPTQYRNFQHQNYGQTEYDRDNYECTHENTHYDSWGTDVDRRMVRTCMYVRGRRPVTG
jgi:hypothetical protein